MPPHKRGSTVRDSLGALEQAKGNYGNGCAEIKLALLARIEHKTLSSARAVNRLHEVLCFLRAYPDDARILAQRGARLA